MRLCAQEAGFMHTLECACLQSTTGGPVHLPRNPEAQHHCQAATRTITSPLTAQVCARDASFVRTLESACLQSATELAEMCASHSPLLPRKLLLQAILVLLQNPLNGDLSGIGRQLVVQLAQVRP